MRTLADFSLAKEPAGPYRVLDLAAGSGVGSIALAEKSPQVCVAVVDWPAVIPVCRKVTARRGVGDRYEYRPGDLLEVDFGAGYQAATLGHILHSEGEKRSRALLKKVFAALAPGGVAAIAEMVPNDDRTGPAMPLIFAVNMLVHTDEGDTFTFGEMSAWLRGGLCEPATTRRTGAVAADPGRQAVIRRSRFRLGWTLGNHYAPFPADPALLPLRYRGPRRREAAKRRRRDPAPRPARRTSSSPPQAVWPAQSTR